MTPKKLAKRGPKTEAGKLVAATNSTRHGILSAKPVVLAFESEHSWRNHRLSVMDSLDPQDGVEQVLAERVALNSWRLNRVAVYETELLNEEQDNLIAEMKESAVRFPLTSSYNTEGFEAQEHATEYKTIYDDLVGLLREEISHLSSPQTARWVSDQAPYTALVDRQYQKDPDNFEEPDVDDDLEKEFDKRIGDEEPPAVSDLREALKWLVDEVGIADDEYYTGYEALMERLCTDVEHLWKQTQEDAEELERNILRRRRHKVVPSEDTLQKIARYEAHLSREMYKALHELEALKAHRAGQTSPLARVDVQGLGS
jgi:hypothetical protein